MAENQTARIRMPLAASEDLADARYAGTFAAIPLEKTVAVCHADGHPFVRLGIHPEDAPLAESVGDTDALLLSQGGDQVRTSVGAIRHHSHSDLQDRDSVDCHPVSAITGAFPSTGGAISGDISVPNVEVAQSLTIGGLAVYPGIRHIESFRPAPTSSDQVTLAAAAASGGPVWFPPGTWALTSNVSVPFASGTVWIGSGYNTLITGSGIDHPFLFDGVSNCHIERIRFSFSRAALTGYTNAIFKYYSETTGASNVVFEDCAFNGTNIFWEYYYGLNDTAVKNVKHNHCTSTLPAASGFHVFMAGRNYVSDNPTGDGINDTFTTSFDVLDASYLAVYVAGHYTTAYTITGTPSHATIVLTTPPALGTSVRLCLTTGPVVETNSFVGAPDGVDGSNKLFYLNFIVPSFDSVKVYDNNTIVSGANYSIRQLESRGIVAFTAAPASGHTIRVDLVNSPQYQGIVDEGHQNVTWDGCEFYGGANGMLLNGDGVRVEKCLFSSVESPIAATFCRGLKLLNSDVLDFSGNGITVGNGTNDIIQGYNVDGNHLYSQRNTLHGINIYKSGGNSEDFPSNIGRTRRGSISNNQIFGASGNAGVFLYGNGYCTVHGNTIEGFGNGVQAATAAGGTHPGNFVISANQIRSTSRGIALGSSDMLDNAMHDYIVSDNMVDAPDIGIYVARSYRGSISGNTFIGLRAYDASTFTGVGIEINFANILKVHGNTVIGSSHIDVWWQLSSGSIVSIQDNIFNGSYARLGTTDPVFINNIGNDRHGINTTAIDNGLAVASNSNTYQASVDFVGGQTSSQNRSGIFLATFTSSRAGSTAYASHHAHAVALIVMARGASGTWTTLSTTYLVQYGATPTITVANVGDVLTFTGSSTSTSADSAFISVQPFTGPLISAIINTPI